MLVEAEVGSDEFMSVASSFPGKSYGNGGADGCKILCIVLTESTTHSKMVRMAVNYHTFSHTHNLIENTRKDSAFISTFLWFQELRLTDC